MYITGVSASSIVSDNIQSQNTETNNLRSLCAACQLPEDVTNEEAITENEDVANDADASEADEAKKAEDDAKAANKAMIMATMVAQYRVEAILGGDPDDESDPMYMSEW